MHKSGTRNSTAVRTRSRFVYLQVYLPSAYLSECTDFLSLIVGNCTPSTQIRLAYTQIYLVAHCSFDLLLQPVCHISLPLLFFLFFSSYSFLCRISLPLCLPSAAPLSLFSLLAANFPISISFIPCFLSCHPSFFFFL